MLDKLTAVLTCETRVVQWEGVRWVRCPHGSNPRLTISIHGTNVFNNLLNFIFHGMRNYCTWLQWANNTFDTVNTIRKHFDSQNLIMQDRGQDMDLKNDAEIKKFGWFLHFTTKWLFEVLRLHWNCPRTGSLPRSTIESLCWWSDGSGRGNTETTQWHEGLFWTKWYSRGHKGTCGWKLSWLFLHGSKRPR